ncbi:hypothetical protein HPB47_027800 [Ixodes persulcatus]|uniref:Uncharacterized protein n=1 Tax=Ixodes persulcatus TaxID=34615 RepID=A0AC60PVG5_IXOPE|nr:hypothetical protein HPB47_027800 [Ixodes persulcatus]
MGKHLTSYTAGFKLKVVAFALEHSKRAARRHYNVDKKCVRRWCNQKDALASMNKTRRAFCGMLQPLYVDVNRPFKVEFRRCYTEWMAISLGIVAKSFKVTGISNKLDGTEDDLVWERVLEQPDSSTEDSSSDQE